jgi:Tfp pilus assembly protein PilN
VIRTNLSTRPFYNERAVHAIALIVGLIVVALAGWQTIRIVLLSKYKTELNASIARDKAESDRQEREAEQIRGKINQKELTVVVSAAKEANELIAQRTFSWTQLFNQLETTLPEDVMLTSIHPDFKDGVTTINLDIQGRRSDDIDAFWEHLEKTGSFHDVQWSDVSVGEDGVNKVEMKAVYTEPPAKGAR